MENINAEIFTLRNQRKLIKGLTDKLKIVLGQFDQLENELIRSQYKSGLMIAFDEIGYDEEMYMKRIKELFDIKQKYHHLWNETQQLYNSTQKHFNSEKILMENLINKINNLTPDKIDGIKLIKKNKQKKKKNIFNDLSNLKNEIDNLEKVKNDLIGMREFVSGNSNKAYYSKEVKDFNSITDKISSEKKKLEQYKKINNSKMIITTNVMITSLENDKKKIIKGTKEAIEETLVSLDSKVLERKKIADKYFKIKKIRILIQGLP